MSKEYRAVAKKLNVRYLFGRWGVSFRRPMVPSEIRRPLLPQLRLIPLNGWVFDPKDIIESLANDPDFSIKYADDPVSDLVEEHPDDK